MCTIPSTPPSACSSTQTAFINKMLPYAEGASEDTGLPVSLILAQWGLETAWMTSCPSCNNPGNYGSGSCACGGVEVFSTLQEGVNAYINTMITNHGYVLYAYNVGGVLEACKALGAGCEPDSGYASAIYATGRYDGVSCNGNAVDNNCYLSTTTTASGVAYSKCAPTVGNNDCQGCNGCGYVGCSLYETATTSCLSPYNCVLASY